MIAISDNLIHFLGQKHKERPDKQLEIFKSIIRNGLRFNKSRVKFGAAGSLANQVICFTDIPLSFCDDHVGEYGKFGIGFKKLAIKHCGGNPVRYFINFSSGDVIREADHRWSMHMNLQIHSEFAMKLYSKLRENPDLELCDQHGQVLIGNESLKNWNNAQWTILSFEKETGEVFDDRYYKEREWRLVPLLGNMESGAVKYDQSDDSYHYMFSREDLNMVVTPSDDMRVEVHEFFRGLEEEDDERLKAFAKNPLPLVAYDELHSW